MGSRNVHIEVDPLARLEPATRDALVSMAELLDGLSPAERQHISRILSTGCASLHRTEEPRPGGEAAASVQLFDLLGMVTLQSAAGLFREGSVSVGGDL